MKLGDLIAKITKFLYIDRFVKWLVIDMLGYESCGWEKRQNKRRKMRSHGSTSSLFLIRNHQEN